MVEYFEGDFKIILSHVQGSSCAEIPYLTFHWKTSCDELITFFFRHHTEWEAHKLQGIKDVSIGLAIAHSAVRKEKWEE